MRGKRSVRAVSQPACADLSARRVLLPLRSVIGYASDMKHKVLRSIGHNIADSLASGCGFLVGLYFFDIFAEAAARPGGFVEIDFLSGKADGEPSASLAELAGLYAGALPKLCASQGASDRHFAVLTARFYRAADGMRFDVTVEDKAGRRTVDHYLGLSGARPKSLDPLGRVRTRRN